MQDGDVNSLFLDFLNDEDPALLLSKPSADDTASQAVYANVANGVIDSQHIDYAQLHQPEQQSELNFQSVSPTVIRPYLATPAYTQPIGDFRDFNSNTDINTIMNMVSGPAKEDALYKLNNVLYTSDSNLEVAKLVSKICVFLHPYSLHNIHFTVLYTISLLQLQFFMKTLHVFAGIPMETMWNIMHNILLRRCICKQCKRLVPHSFMCSSHHDIHKNNPTMTFLRACNAYSGIEPL